VWGPTHKWSLAHDLRRNGRIILECRKARFVSGHNRECWTTNANSLCDYREHGCRACQETFLASIVMCIRIAFWTWRMRRNWHYRRGTMGPKWDSGHIVACVWYAPDDVCICDQAIKYWKERKG